MTTRKKFYVYQAVFYDNPKSPLVASFSLQLFDRCFPANLTNDPLISLMSPVKSRPGSNQIHSRL